MLGRVEKPPSLESMLEAPEKKPKRQQTWQEQLEATAAWVASFGAA